MALIVVYPVAKQFFQFLFKSQFNGMRVVMIMAMAVRVVMCMTMGMVVVMRMVMGMTVTVVVVVVVVVVMCHKITPFKYFSRLTGSGVY